MKAPQLPQPSFDYISFNGGLDQVTPVLNTRPGTLSDSQNYEIDINGGYQDIMGYERFDGQPSPSDADYAILDVTITGSIAVGNTITGVTSAATAKVIAVVNNDYLVITKIVGTFVAETLNVGGSPQGTTPDGAIVDGASSALLHAQYKNLAADEYRSDIAAVPGSGRILGIMMLSDVKYAFRNNAGGTAAALYKSSSSGWTAVALGRELSFTSGGTYEVVEGNTITGAISGATAVITRVSLESGSWAAGTAAGRFIFASQTGTFQAENLNVGATLNVATIAGDSTAIALLPSGRYEVDYYNFGTAKRAYGCDGVNRGFEFDGTVFAPIATGMTTDTPTHVKAHVNQLLFSFGNNFQNSGIGTPFNWTLRLGAAAIGTQDTITGFKTEAAADGSGTIAIYNRNALYILYGTSSANWNLVKYSDEAGAYAYTIQKVHSTIFLDDRGVTTLSAAQTYGNFADATISALIQPFLNEKRFTATDSCIVRDKNQYRLFFSSGYGIYFTFLGPKLIGAMPVLFPAEVRCMFSLENSSGVEEIFFGSDDGFVYQMEKGTSFDGAAIEAFFTLHYHHSKRPRIKKRYMGITLEASGTGYAQFELAYTLGYGSTYISQPSSQTETLSFSGVNWDSFVWDAFIWDGQTLTPSNLKLSGSAENIAITIRKNSDYFSPVRFSGALLRLLFRNQLR